MASITKKLSGAQDVDEYLARLPEKQRAALERMRRAIKSVVPNATEGISYQIPTFKLDGRMLVSFAAFTEHCSFFPGAGPTEVHQNELQSYQTSKGTVRFTVDKPLPIALIKKIVKTRIRLNKESLKRRADRKEKAPKK